MRMSVKNIIVFLLDLCMTLSLFAYRVKDVHAIEYEDCIKNNLTAEEKAACRVLQKELNQKAAGLNDELNAIKKQKDDLIARINDTVNVINEYKSQIEELDEQIVKVEADILVVEANINDLLVQIQIREDNIKTIDENIKDRLLSAQSFAHINNYIEFFMGATSFMDLIRRVEAINDIQKYDDYLLDLLNEEMIKLNEEKEELERQEEMLADQKNNLQLQKEYVEGLKQVYDEMIAAYYAQKADLEALEQSYVDDLTSVQTALKNVSEALNYIEPSPGWTKPVKGSLNASTWHYPSSFGGGTHLGIDVGASVGTTVRAAANGYIMFSSDACPTYGYLGSKCGYPGSTSGGNQVYLLCTVNGKTYMVKYLHLKSGTPIEMGKIVMAGDKIGETGASGNTSGPHCHIEIFYLGENSVTYYANKFAETGDLAWGCGYGSKGLSNTCDKKGAPCRLAPASILGYSN